MEEHTSFRRSEKRERGGEEGSCHNGRGDGVLLFDGHRKPPRDQPQQLQATNFTIPNPKSLGPKLACFFYNSPTKLKLKFVLLSPEKRISTNIESKPRPSNCLK